MNNSKIWRIKLEQIKINCINNIVNDKSLKEWLIRQMKNCKHRQQIMKKNDIYNEFMDFCENDLYKSLFLQSKHKWKSKLLKLKNFIDTHHKLVSSTSKNYNEKTLSEWLFTQLKNCKYRQQIMKEDDIYNEFMNFKNNDLYQQFFRSDKKIAWRTNLQNLKEFFDTFQIRPNKLSDNPNEKKNGIFLSNQIVNYKIRKFIMKEDDIYDEWILFINSDQYNPFFTKKITLVFDIL